MKMMPYYLLSGNGYSQFVYELNYDLKNLHRAFYICFKIMHLDSFDRIYHGECPAGYFSRNIRIKLPNEIINSCKIKNKIKKFCSQGKNISKLIRMGNESNIINIVCSEEKLSDILVEEAKIRELYKK